ncbi:hypothetical protein COOONC_26893 [Cooperia oncophora]
MKRNCLSQATPYSINLKSERVVHYRVIISDGTGACLFDSTKQKYYFEIGSAAQPAPPSFLYVNQYIKDVVKREDDQEDDVYHMASE